MPNLGSVLKDEISRLARRALKGEVEGVKKASAQHRRHIAALKRQVGELERQVATLARGAAAARPSSAATGSVRFVAKGLRSRRERLGLSAAAFGKLAGVSAQTIYNWERGLAHPQKVQLARLVALRGMGKRDAASRLAAMGAATARKGRRKR